MCTNGFNYKYTNPQAGKPTSMFVYKPTCVLVVKPTNVQTGLPTRPQVEKPTNMFVHLPTKVLTVFSFFCLDSQYLTKRFFYDLPNHITLQSTDTHHIFSYRLQLQQVSFPEKVLRIIKK